MEAELELGTKDKYMHNKAQVRLHPTRYCFVFLCGLDTVHISQLAPNRSERLPRLCHDYHVKHGAPVLDADAGEDGLPLDCFSCVSVLVTTSPALPLNLPADAICIRTLTSTKTAFSFTFGTIAMNMNKTEVQGNQDTPCLNAVWEVLREVYWAEDCVDEVCTIRLEPGLQSKSQEDRTHVECK